MRSWPCRLLGLYNYDDLKDAEPDTLRYRLPSLPARLVRHARARIVPHGAYGTRESRAAQR